MQVESCNICPLVSNLFTLHTSFKFHPLVAYIRCKYSFVAYFLTYQRILKIFLVGQGLDSGGGLNVINHTKESGFVL